MYLSHLETFVVIIVLVMVRIVMLLIFRSVARFSKSGRFQFWPLHHKVISINSDRFSHSPTEV